MRQSGGIGAAQKAFENPRVKPVEMARSGMSSTEVLCRGTTPKCSSYAKDRDKKLKSLGGVVIGS
jgi:hypothetical protein